MHYTITDEGKIKLNRNLNRWRVAGTDNLYATEPPGPKERAQEKEFSALISRCTKELSLDQEQAVILKEMKKQEQLDQLAEF